MITRILIDARKIDTQKRMDKINDVAVEMNTIINSKYFMDQVLKMKTHGERSKFKDLSNKEIYEKLMKGAELFKEDEDYTWNIFIDDYFSWKGVIGYTTRNTKTINVNTRFFDKRHRAQCGSNIVHEQGHKLGFSHDKSRTKARPYSVCYQLNIAYETAYSRIFNVYPEEKTFYKRSIKSFFRKVKYTKKVWPQEGR